MHESTTESLYGGGSGGGDSVSDRDASSCDDGSLDGESGLTPTVIPFGSTSS